MSDPDALVRPTPMMNMNPTVKIGFAARQTRESRFSHYEGEGDHLCRVIAGNVEKWEAIVFGIMKLRVDPEGFFSSVKLIGPGDVLKTVCEPRREGEEAVLSTVVVGGKKVPAKFVEIILYHRDKLGADASTDAEWEVVSINASPFDGPIPMDPTTMARNLLVKTGGTFQREYPSKEWAEAAWFWARHANVEP